MHRGPRYIFKRDWALHSWEKQTTQLQLLHKALQTVPPTSVEAERVFSAGGLFLTKLRSSMSDKTLDKLIFLKLFFALKNEHIF